MQITAHLPAVINPRKERHMATEGTFTMKLTQQQKEEIRKVTGKDAEVLELSVEELEERIAPAKTNYRPNI
jgi:hypothetical protein